MNVDKLNLIAYRVAGIIISLFLLLGGWGMLDAHRTTKGYIGIVAGVLEIVLQFKRPSIGMWVSLVVILLVAMFFVGGMHD